SPGLMQHPPQQPAAQPPHLLADPVAIAAAVAPAPAAMAPAVVTPAPAAKTVYVTPAKPMTVAFEPFPGVASSSVGADIISYHQPDHPTSKEYTVLLETLLGGLKSGKSGVVMLSGVKAKVGTSTVILNLAVSAAQAQK